VNKLACAGRVRGTGVVARVKDVPRAASASRTGVHARSEPKPPTWSARVVSRVTSTTLGKLGSPPAAGPSQPSPNAAKASAAANRVAWPGTAADPSWANDANGREAARADSSPLRSLRSCLVARGSIVVLDLPGRNPTTAPRGIRSAAWTHSRP